MKKSIPLYISFVSLFLIWGCTKDKLNNSSDCAELFVSSNLQFITFYENDLPHYSSPCFNPKDSNEIIYIRADGLDTIKMFKYNFITKEKTEILKAFVYSIPDWSVKDWIIFTQADFNVYKIKSNGDSLTQLTTSDNCFGPKWNIDGNSFIYHEGFTVPVRGIICEENGIVRDTLIGIGGSNDPSWNHQLLIAYNEILSVITVNPNTNQIDTIYEININEAGLNGGAEWLDNETILWSCQKGIFTTNIISKETIPLKESCNSILYLFPTYSPQRKQIIFQKMEKFQTGEKAGKAVSKLIMMSLDGFNEEVIELE